MTQLVDHRGNPLVRTPKPRASLAGGEASWFPYDGSSFISSELEGWYPLTYSPDYEINVHRDRMVGRSRDLVRNDGWASGGVTRITDSVVGGHYRLCSQPDYRALSYIDKAFDTKWAYEFRHAVEAKWREWAYDPSRYCDAEEQLTFTQAMRLALRTKIIDGEDLFVMEWMPQKVGYGGAKFATCFHMVDPDRLSNPREMIDTKHRRGGVQIDDQGVPLGYHIRRAHQFDWYNAVDSMIWDYIPRQTEWGRTIVIHDYDRDRVGEHRGISAFMPVMNRMKMLTKYDRAELQSAIINAAFALFMQSPNDPEGLREAMDAGTDEELSLGRWYWDTYSRFRKDRPVNVDGATVVQGFAGEKPIQIKADRPGNNHDAFTFYTLRNIAAQLGTTAEQLTQDWSKANYSSIRASIIEARKTVMRRRAEFGENTATPIFVCFLEELFDSGELDSVLPNNAVDFMEARTAFSRCRWIGPGQGWVDPLKERQGTVLGIAAGLSTLEAACGEQGEDWEEVLDQLDIENARRLKSGLAPLGFTGKAPSVATEEREAESGEKDQDREADEDAKSGRRASVEGTYKYLAEAMNFRPGEHRIAA